MFIRSVALAAVLGAAGAGWAQAQEHTRNLHGPEHGGHEEGKVVLLEGLGSWTQKITTSVPQAQKFFDQGLRLAYGFNHDESARSFEEALRLDPSCAMCAWGVAYALSPNINLPMDSAKEVRALAAIRRAQSLAAGATARERDYVAAMSHRFGEPAGAQRVQRDSAYARAMRDVAARYPTDADAQVLYADAMMNLRPWDQWTRDGEPKPGTLEVVDVLERALKRAPEHAGACHFYVHAVEASTAPERALPCAQRLPKLMPGAGHVVHMPAHVYLRVGMYEKAVRANIAAVEADRRYFAGHDVQPGVYPMFYHPHNIHFLWAAYMLSGQKAKSLDAAQALMERVSIDAAREASSLEAFLTARFLTHVRFGDWEAVLREPRPAEGLKYATAMWHHARGIAQAGLGRIQEAEFELERVREINATVPADMIIIINPAQRVLKIAELTLDARIAAVSGDIARAVLLLREASAIEDQLGYDEPPPWYQSVRQTLGDVLLAAGRYAQAESAYRDDLVWMKENGWSLAGLERALRAQGRTEEAKAVEERLEEAWKYADVPPTAPAPAIRFRQSTLRTGARIHWAESGDPKGRAVVMLHGYSDSWFSFSRIMPLLPSNVRAIAIDMRGHGESGDAPGTFSIDEVAADVAAVMDELGILRATIVGHSYGSLVAQGFAATHPERVDALVLLGGVSRGTLPVMSELRGEVMKLSDPVPQEFIREFQVSTITRPVPQAFFDRVMVESGKLSAAAWRGIADGWDSADYRNRLGGVKRSLVIWGDRDAYFKEDVQRELRAALPQVEFVTLPGTGHAVHWEEPGRVAGLLADLLLKLQEG